MWSSPLFRKLFFGFALLYLAIVAIFFVGARFGIARLANKMAESRLLDAAQRVAREVNAASIRDRSAELQELAKSSSAATGLRITIVRANGELVGDSLLAETSDPLELDVRDEFRDAKLAGRGVARRTSMEKNMLFVALRIGEEPIGFVRAGMESDIVHQQLASSRALSWWLFLAAVFLGAAGSYFIAARIAQPLVTMQRAVEDVSEGFASSWQHDIERNDEVGLLSRGVEQIHSSLSARVSELDADNARLLAVLEGMAEGVIAVDQEERVLLANSASGDLLGSMVEDPTGRFLIDVARFTPISNAVQRALEVQTPQSDEFQLPRGGRRLVIRATPLSADADGSAPVGVVLVLRDVTELRRLESLRSEFVANVSHELKTPLAAVQAYTETLELGAINDPENNMLFLGRIQEQADRLHQLIVDLLMLARVESEQEVYEIVIVNAAETVDEVVADFRSEFEAKALRVDVVHDEMDLRVEADQECLRTILSNLISNAIKYTPREGAISVRCLNDESDVLLEVIDTGDGIPPEHQQRVFERFYRVDKARSREVGGTGLGLSIVKHLVGAFGGSVGVESEPGQGSRFFVRLPMVLGESQPK